MLCQKCQANEATIHLTEIAGTKKSELHLCEGCAQAQGVSLTKVQLHNMASAALQQVQAAQQQEELADLDVTCTRCGMSLAEFKRKGRLGCAEDYDAFQVQLEPLLDRMHHSIEHTGKVPARHRVMVETQRTLRDSRKRLQEAITQERYEEAARLRDAIKDLEDDEARPEPVKAPTKKKKPR